jgi:hypothetical protein
MKKPDVCLEEKTKKRIAKKKLHVSEKEYLLSSLP